MIRIENVLAGSNWDTGAHKGFWCGVQGLRDQYTFTSLDKLLTPDEITKIEKLIAMKVYEILKQREWGV